MTSVPQEGGSCLRWVALLLAAFVTVAGGPAHALQLDSWGREFIFGFLPAASAEGDGVPWIQMIAQDATATVQVEYPVGTVYRQNVIVTSKQRVGVELPVTAQTEAGWQTAGNAVRITASANVSVVMQERGFGLDEAALALPVDALGTEYINPAEVLLVVVAIQDDTFLSFDGGESTLLQRAQGLLTTGASGVKVIFANKPVAVTFGDKCRGVPAGYRFCEHLLEFGIPISRWGTEVLALNTPGAVPAPGVRHTFYRVTAAANDTSLMLDGTQVATLSRGGVYSFDRRSPASAHLKASKPILVMQYTNSICHEFPDPTCEQTCCGDPAMLTLLPTSQYPRRSTVVGDSINLVARTEDVQSNQVLLDGVPIPSSLFAAYASSPAFSNANVVLSGGAHVIESANGHSASAVRLGPATAETWPAGLTFDTSCAGCLSLGKNCGSVADGCGEMLNCGTCSPPKSCGGGGLPNVCGCLPTTCAEQSAECGAIPDGCGGTLNCGGCDDDDACTTDTCVGKACAHAVKPGCCSSDADCVSTVCTTVSCVANSCQPTPVPNCCETVADCDDSQVCTIDSCVANRCQYAWASSTTVCRPAVGECDAAETCTGSSSSCPADVLHPPSRICRRAGGDCDLAERCTGTSVACPADVKVAAGSPCRPVAGPCDIAETCTGSADACPTDMFQPASTECRAAAGFCDVAEKCTGGSPTCPADVLQPPTMVCRPSAGDCDVAETCTGNSPACPANVLQPSTVVCRQSAGACDMAETCTGTSAACPADQRRAAGETCREAAAACDREEVCDGTGLDCPGDVQRAPGEQCDDGDPETGTSSCTTAPQPQCQGVTTQVEVQAEIPVPASQTPKQVRIPVAVVVPDTPGTKQATVVVKGLVDCLDVPSSLWPKPCRRVDGASATGYPARVRSVILRVTPRRKRRFGRTQGQSAMLDLPLTKLGRKLYAKLGGSLGGLPMQVRSSLRDRRGRKIDANFPTVLRRQQ